jgi:hypothetical protein
MIKGNVNLSHITYEMLEELVFTEKTKTREANGHWRTFGVSTPNFPADSDIVYQNFGDNCPPWVNNLIPLFDSWLNYSIVTINKLTPGCFIPSHTDELYRIKQKVLAENIDVSSLVPVRVNLFLQNKELGHIFEMEGKFLDEYKQGDFTFITPNKIHSVANLGYINRYTMQLTGFAKLEDIT